MTNTDKENTMLEIFVKKAFIACQERFEEVFHIHTHERR